MILDLLGAVVFSFTVTSLLFGTIIVFSWWSVKHGEKYWIIRKMNEILEDLQWRK